MLGDSMYLENIREYVEDHKLIVTYKWLSRELDVPANAAKQMLYSYKQQDPSVTVTYLISGLVGSSELTDYEVHVVKEVELEKMKEKFHTVLGLHIFSVQNVELKNADSLFAASYDACINSLDKYSRWSPIDCPVETTPHPVQTTPRPVETTPHPVSAPVKTPPATEQPKKAHAAPSFPPHAQQSRDKKPNTSTSQPAKAAAKKVLSKKPKKPFFPITEKKVEKEKAPVIKEEKLKEEPVCVVQEKTDATPVTSSPEDSPRSSDERQDSMKHSKLKFLEDSDIDDGESEEEPVTKCRTTSNGQAKKVKQAKGVKGEATVLGGTKKRKRVQELSSDEEKPAAEESQQELGIKQRRKRVKKMVSKTYINEDDEMVTERVWETDSTSVSEASGGEGVVEESIEPASQSDVALSSSSPAKPPVRQGKKKQASLFMFAKKT